MGVTQYIGARYMPIFADPPEHSSAKTYEPLTIVLHEGNSYTSKQFVPKGIAITNEAYWAETGNFNGQVEAYRQEVRDLTSTVSEYDEQFADLKAVLPYDSFSSEYTVEDAINAGSKNALWDRPVSFEKIGNLPTAVGLGNLQGCTCDINGNIYAYYDKGSSSVLRKINRDTLSLDGEYVFATYAGHGNSINYDSALNAIVCISNNRNVAIIDTDLNLVSQYNYGTTNNSLSISSFALSDEYLIARFTGTQLVGFYKRLDTNFFAMYSAMDAQLPMNNYNLMQDSFMYDYRMFSVIGSSESKKYITEISINGVQASRYVVDGVDLEPEGFFTDNTYVYIVDRDENVFRASLTEFGRNQNVGTYANPSQPVVVNYRKAYVNNSIVPADELNKFFRVTNSLQLRVPFIAMPKNIFALQPQMLASVNSTAKSGIVTTSGAGAIRINAVTYEGYYIRVYYNANTAAGYQYLASIDIRSLLDGTLKRYTFTENISDEDVATIYNQIQSDFPNVLTEISFYGKPELTVNYSYNIYLG